MIHKKLSKYLLKLYFKIFVKFSKKFSRENLYNYLEESIEKYIFQNREFDIGKLNIINVGAGGEISKTIKKKLKKFVEIDIDAKRSPDLILDIQNVYLIKNNSIDVVFCFEVLEHVKNTFKAVKEIKRILKPEGIFIGSTPFIFPIPDEPHDYFRYTKYGILNLFNKFEVLELKERNSYTKSLYVLLLRLLNTGTTKQRIIGIMLFPFMLLLCPFVLLFNKLITNRQATTGYFYVLKKPY